MARAADGNGADRVVFKADLSYAGDAAPEETFELAVEPLDGAPEPLSAATQQCKLSFHTPQGEAEFAFGFDAEGLYRYRLTEKKGSNPRISYSDAEYLLEFEVYRNYGELECVVRASRAGDEAAKPATAQFENSYTPASSVQSDPPIKIRKSITGDAPPEKSPFVFVMEPEDGAYPLPTPDSDAVRIADGKAFVTLVGEGEVEIGVIEFTEPGIYSYTLRERDDRVVGYTYDDAVFTVVYTVTTDATTGELVCRRNMYRNIADWNGECDFANSYSASGAARNRQGAPKTGDALAWVASAVLGAAAVGASLTLAGASLRRRE